MQLLGKSLFVYNYHTPLSFPAFPLAPTHKIRAGSGTKQRRAELAGGCPAGLLYTSGAPVLSSPDPQWPSCLSASGFSSSSAGGVGLPHNRRRRRPRFNLSVAKKKIPEVTDKRVYRIYRKISRSKIKQNNT
jgi:hypothetical protein